MNNHILCPHCKKEFELTDAFRHQIEEEILKESKKDHEKELDKLKLQLDEENKKFSAQLETVKKQLEADIKKTTEEEYKLKLKDNENEREELRKKAKEHQEEMLKLMQDMRRFKDESERRELEMQKKLNEELEKKQEEITKTIAERARLKELELEKKLSDTQKALEDAQRKATQGSQQLQGEILELNIEKKLRDMFPNDEFLPVPKGVEGADIIQKVNDGKGNDAGTIVWELKRTKSFSKGWLAKLREDTRTVNGSMSILVSEVLPDEIKYYGTMENVWVVSFEHSLSVAFILRSCLVKIARSKEASSYKDEKLQILYEYITSEAFRHKIESHFESVKTLRDDLESEKRMMERIWKKREIQVARLDRSASQLFGELQGILGSSLPSVKALEGTSETDYTVKTLLDEAQERLLD